MLTNNEMFLSCQEKPDGTVTVTRRMDYISNYDLDGSFDDAILTLQKKKAETEADYPSAFRIFLDWRKAEYDDDNELAIMVEQVLTDEEMAQYQEYKEAKTRQNLEYQRQQFEHLKKMFPNG